MGKLHELLAIENNLENQANKVRSELQNTFDKKKHLFEEKRITFIPFGENESPVVEQQLDLQSTVKKELAWVSGHLVKAIDAGYQIAKANTVAKADVVLEDGSIILKDVPATSLLELEKRIAEIQQLVANIPTLDPSKGFIIDQDRGAYKAREITKNRTKKQPRVLVKYEATKEHPAQTEIIVEDVPIGKITEQEWSGMITPAEKSEMMARVDSLSRAIRAARSRANEAVVDSSGKIGKQLLDYIFQSK